jgi:hypothetical protein
MANMMANNGWVLIGNMAVFNTATSGNIIVTRATYDAMRPALQNITTTSTTYHEYGPKLFNTEVKVRELPLKVMQTLLAANPTPFDSYFAGPGFVYPGEGVGGAVVNITTRFPFHLLDPGLVQRKIIVINGVYYIETIGIGEGALGEINENETALELAWGFGAGVTLKERAFELINEGYVPKCFPATTHVQTSSTETKPISEIRVGDVVMSFDPTADGGRGALVPKRVKRLFRNTTTEWIKLTWLENSEAKELVATPGHHMLDKTGAFMRLDLMVQNGKAEIVLASGEVVEAKAEHITYSTETAHLFAQATPSTNPATIGAAGLMN